MRQRLIDYRKSIKKTQEEMAEIWGISLSHYKKIECGAKNPSLEKIKIFKIRFPSANVTEIFLFQKFTKSEKERRQKNARKKS